MSKPFAALTAVALLCSAAPAIAVQADAPALDAAPDPVANPAVVPSMPLTAVPALPAPTAGSMLPSAVPVDAYYQARSNALLWFRDAASLEGARLLPAILRRGQIEGLANAAELARLVEAAIAAAQAPVPVPPPAKKGAARLPKPNPFVAEDKMLSAAWVQYVRALHAPVPGMIYGDPALAPKPPLADRILLQAENAPSLALHVAAVATVNPVYARLRESVWGQVQVQLEPQLQLVSATPVEQPVLTNLAHARLLPAKGRLLVVNLATAKLSMYEDGQLVDSMKVVIGKPDTPTPMLAGTIHYATFNPYWNIPTDVARRVVAPLVIKRGVSYLSAARYEVASDWTDQASVVDATTVDWKAVADGTTKVRIRQLPGAGNMMGAIKFGFANDLGIYLHDTPNKTLFAKAKRNYSLGCVRVEDARRLARWLFGKEPEAPSDLPEQHVKIASPVAIYLTHLTLPEGTPLDSQQLTSTKTVKPVDPPADAPPPPGTLSLLPERADSSPNR